MASIARSCPLPEPVRCAIYTRKSTEEGLNQDFNSLDAQREAAENYIRSQASEGWSRVPGLYDDGGYTGANMDRPAVKRLLEDIQAGKIDCVVVYKVDRLSRSIRDFAKMMELFEKNNVSFVSVTQQFNTTTSLGRLTLNILLSFAQFEREIISERTKDKQAAARKKGKWTGGYLILGYDLDPAGGRLLVNEAEAERVRTIFQWYLDGTPVSRIVLNAAQRGWRNKQWTTRAGTPCGGHPLRKGHIYNVLANVLYTGRITVDGETYPAEHAAIVDQKTFNRAQEQLRQSPFSREGKQSGARRKMDALLRGIIYCACCGSAMYPTYSASKEKRYRYYVCVRGSQQSANCTTRSVSAPAVEEAVVESIRRIAVAPKIMEQTAEVIRERLSDELRTMRAELADLNAKVKNWKSQLARMRNRDREAALRKDISVADGRAAELRTEIKRRDRFRVNDGSMRNQFANLDEIWKVMHLEEQTKFVRCLVEKVGYDNRTAKVTVSFKSASIKELCAK